LKILFVCSGNSECGLSPIVKSQGESLTSNGIHVDYYAIQGKGFLGYFKNIFQLNKFLKNNHYDIIHSHFFLSSIVASLASSNKQVASLMGSDVYTSSTWNFFIKLFHKRWDATVVKSEIMKEILELGDVFVIPNGVDLDKFYPIDKQAAMENLGWSNMKYILFASGTERPEKNFGLAQQAVKLLNDEEIELVTLKDITHELIVNYLNSANLLLMTSKYEGSPNIIKEAMACNCPIVSTDVGDVKEIIGNTAGCFITSFDPNDVAEKIKSALVFDKRTKGRERIIELGLNSNTVAKRIINIYEEVVAK